VESREKIYRRLLDLAAQLTATLDSEAIAKATVTLLAEAMQADVCAVICLGPEREQGRIGPAWPECSGDAALLSGGESLGLLENLRPQEPLVITGKSHPGLERLRQRLRVQSLAMFPLQTAGRMPTILLLGYAADRPPLSSEDLALLSEMSHLVASALENSRLYQQTHRRLQELRLLYEVSLAVSTLLDLDQIVGRVLEALSRHIAVHTCALYIVDQAQASLRGHPASRGLPVPPEEISISTGHGRLGWVVQTGQALLVPDVTRDPRATASDSGDIRSEVCVPVVVGGRVAAVLDLASRQPAALGQEDLDLASRVAGQLAVAMERSQVLQQAHQRVRELTALMRMSSTIQGPRGWKK